MAITFTGPGPYTVNVWRVRNASPHCSSDVKTLNVTVEQVNLTILGNALPCANTHENYSVAYIQGETYEWEILPHTAGSVSNGNGTQNIEVVWNNTGTSVSATLTVKVRKCGNTTSESLNITVQGLPTIALTGPSNVCIGTEFNIGHNAPAGSNFVVDFGDGVIQTFTNHTGDIPYTYQNTGQISSLNYTISVSVLSSQFCINPVIVTKTITFNPSPLVAISPASSNVWCTPLSEPLTATLQAGVGSTTTFTWHFPSGVQSPCSSQAFMCYTQNANSFGDYYVVATGANGCTSTSNIVHVIQYCGGGSECEVNPEPELSITVDVNSCGHIELTGNHSVTGINQDWDFPPNLENIVINTSSLPSTLSADAKIAGEYLFKYFATYNGVDNQPCTKRVIKSIIVPIVPDILYGMTCASTGYNFTLYDHSSIYPGVQIDNYDFYINNSPLYSGVSHTYVHPCVLTPGTYTVKVIITYTYNGIQSTCESEKTMELPGLPVANFDFDMNHSCEGVAVVFTNTSSNYVTSFWDFADQATNRLENVERVFQYNFNPYNVNLTVTNSQGCTNSLAQLVSITENNLEAFNNLDATPSPICSGGFSTLEYNNVSTGTPTLYTWHHDDIHLFAGVNNTLAVSQAGAYWVTASNQFKCTSTTPAINLEVINLPEPVIRGSNIQCAGNKFTHDGFAGDDLLYEWIGSSSGFISNDPRIEQTLATAGTYTYQLTISNLLSTCSKTVSFEVTVNDPPSKPALAFNMIDCANYEMNLFVTNVQAGNYNWSNGDNGSSINAYIGGVYKVWLTDPGGCTSSEEINVPKDTKGYLWGFPEGCYAKCLPPSGEFVINGPIIPFDYWEWKESGSTIQSGSNSIVDPLHISSAGSYSLLLDNSLCQAESGTLNLSILEDCGDTELCDSLTVDMDNLNIQGCSISFDLIINNSTGTNYSYSIFTDVGGTVIPGFGLILTGGSTKSFVWATSPGTYGGGPIIFTLRIWLPGNKYCDKIFELEYNCEVSRAKVVAKSSTLLRVNKFEPVKMSIFLKAAPNPAHNNSIVNYKTPGKKNLAYNMEIYNMMGIKVYTNLLSSIIGNIPLNTSNWPAGIYNIVLRENGATIKTTKLLVAR